MHPARSVPACDGIKANARRAARRRFRSRPSAVDLRSTSLRVGIQEIHEQSRCEFCPASSAALFEIDLTELPVCVAVCSDLRPRVCDRPSELRPVSVAMYNPPSVS